jgi:hypothetical protein
VQYRIVISQQMWRPLRHRNLVSSPSYHAAKAVDYAGNLAQLIGAQLTLLHFYDESLRQITVAGVHRYESMLEQERTAKNNLYALRDEIRKNR